MWHEGNPDKNMIAFLLIRLTNTFSFFPVLFIGAYMLNDIAPKAPPVGFAASWIVGNETLNIQKIQVALKV